MADLSLSQQYIDDFHTHLFPPQFSGFNKSGIVELLNYHYLIPELIRALGVPALPKGLSPIQLAELCWNTLFHNTSIQSYSCSGVSRILHSLGISYEHLSFEQLLSAYHDVKPSISSILSSSRIQRIVMTNDPFDKLEWSFISQTNWDRDLYIPSLRLDSLMNTDSLVELHSRFEYIDTCILLSRPIYLSLSLDSKSLSLLCSDIFKPLFHMASKHALPLYLMIGVKRGVNPSLGQAGDAIDSSVDIAHIETLCSSYPDNKFILSHLLLSRETELCVLSRKFPNLLISGYWWYLSTPSLIQSSLRTRIELLGSSHITYFSDARIDEHLLYKRDVIEECIDKVLLDYSVSGVATETASKQEAFKSQLLSLDSKI